MTRTLGILSIINLNSITRDRFFRIDYFVSYIDFGGKKLTSFFFFFFFLIDYFVAIIDFGKSITWIRLLKIDF